MFCISSSTPDCVTLAPKGNLLYGNWMNAGSDNSLGRGAPPDRVEGWDDFVSEVAALPAGRRSIVAIAGAPGSGKSTIADNLAVRLNQTASMRAAVLPMDGYHFDNAILSAMGRLDRKGAPDTFDVGGLQHMLRRLRANTEETIAVPVFDRELEVSRGAARLIQKSIDIVLVEGNYLLSARQPWNSLAPSFDLTALIDVPEEILRARLMKRWLSYGYSEDEATMKAEANDIPNGRYVREASARPDFVIRMGG